VCVWVDEISGNGEYFFRFGRSLVLMGCNKVFFLLCAPVFNPNHVALAVSQRLCNFLASTFVDQKLAGFFRRFLSSHLSLYVSMSSQTLPAFSAPLVPTTHHDIYPRIDPSSTLAESASSLIGVLITGSGRGVGRSTALAFAQAGAKKVVLTSRTRKELEQVKKEIEGLGKGTQVRIVEVDLTKEESVDRLFEEAGEVDGEFDLFETLAKKFELTILSFMHDSSRQ